MTSIGDQLMVRYTNPANVDTLLIPAADVNRDRMKALLAEVYESRYQKVESVDSVTIDTKHFQVPVVEPVRLSGTLEKLLPASERSIGSVEVPFLTGTRWIDMELAATVAVRVSISSSALESVTSEDVSELSQPAFINKFKFLDLPALMKAGGVTSYQELQADFPRLYNLVYGTPPPYDPKDPATKRTYRLRISVLFFPTLDIEGALRRVAETRRALDALRSWPQEYEGGDVRGASAWVSVFPNGVFTANVPISQNQLTALFAVENVVVAYETV